MPITFSVQVWFRRAGFGARDAPPPRAALALMLADLGARCDAAGLRPLRLVECALWPPGTFSGARAVHYLARLSIAAGPGAFDDGPMARWYQWQHPRWGFAPAGGAGTGTIDGAADGEAVLLLAQGGAAALAAPRSVP
jgi:hypothetical protein